MHGALLHIHTLSKQRHDAMHDAHDLCTVSSADCRGRTDMVRSAEFSFGMGMAPSMFAPSPCEYCTRHLQLASPAHLSPTLHWGDTD